LLEGCQHVSYGQGEEPVGGVLAMVEQRQAQRRGRVLGGVRSTSEDHRATPVAVGLLLAALPAAAVLPPLVGLAGLVLIMAALIVVETTRYAQIRRDLRGAESP
jgi:Flp pilus assembly protein TadB